MKPMGRIQSRREPKAKLPGVSETYPNQENTTHRSAMSQSIAAIALLVPDYDEAIAYFTGVLGFELVEDTALSETKRWVLVAPRGAAGARLLLARAKNDDERALIGRQGGGRVLFFLHTDDFDRDYNAYKAAGVEFTETPRAEIYGKVVVFKDVYGNKWDLVGRTN